MGGEFNLERTVEDLRAGISTEESFQRLVTRYQPTLTRFFARCGVPQEERNDLTQETFLGIYTGIDAFRGEARFESWIFTIAANVYRKHLRRGSASKRTAEELSLDETEPTAETSLAQRLVDESVDQPDPERSLLTAERTQQLLRAVDALPERMRKCLILRVFQDLSYEEIAVILRLSSETVRSHLFHARHRLREQLSDHEVTKSDSPGGVRG